jgi:hypothetical protein
MRSCRDPTAIESGTTAHSFVLEAIAERVTSEELRQAFLNEE